MAQCAAIVADRRVQASERRGADPHPIEHMQTGPSCEGDQETAPFEAARRSDYRSRHIDHGAQLTHALYQIEILKDWKRPKSPNLLVRCTPYKDCRIAVGESESSEFRIQPGHEPCRRSLAIEEKVEVAGYNLRVMKRFNDEICSVRGNDRVRVQEPQHVTLSNARTAMHLQTASALRSPNYGPARSRNFAPAVIAPPSNDSDPVGH